MTKLKKSETRKNTSLFSKSKKKIISDCKI